MLADLAERFQEAVQAFWDARSRQQQKQVDAGKIDAGTRGAVTGGTQMGALAPFLGYFFLLEDCAKVHAPVASSEPYFTVDPVFQGGSYARRYEVLCERLVLERKYTSACLALATKDEPISIAFPTDALNFRQFAAAIDAHARAFINTR